MPTYDVTGAGKVVIGTPGKDTINVKSGKDHIVFANNGSDIINVKGGNNCMISAGNMTGSAKDEEGRTDSKNTKDIIKIYGGKKNTIIGGPRKNDITMFGGNVKSILGGNGDDDRKSGDVITIKKGSTISNETYSPTYGQNYGISAAAGNDKITFEKGAGSGVVIFADQGADTIVIKGGSKHQINAGTGNDTIIISAGNNHIIHTDAGTDKVTVSAGSGHKLYLDKGTNNVTLNAVSKSSKITLYGGGTSTDKITVKWKNGTKTGGIYSINTESHTRYSYTDTLRITGIKSSAFQFKNKSGTLVMSNSNGSISVNNMFASLHNTFTKGVTFDDRTLSVSALLKKTK